MVKLSCVAVSLAALLATTQAYAQSAQTGDCKGEISKTESLLATVKDHPDKQAAVEEMNMAKDMAAKNDEQGCMTHLSAARERLLDLEKRGERPY